MLSRLTHSPLAWLVLALGAAGLAVGLALFQPWKLWVDKTVEEALPGPVGATADPTPGTERSATPAGRPVATRQLYGGTFISHEHQTTGTIRIVELADGSRVLRLEDLDTSNGPDLKVWITDAPVVEGRTGWRVFDDGEYVDLGSLKGNLGSQNYAIPADVDLSKYGSVAIWCDRFNVSFGAATLIAA